jgi:hypothetical protein
MMISRDNLAIRNAIFDFERRIEEFHVAIQKYYQGIEKKLPEWERLETELLQFSRRRIQDMELSKNLERVQYKFQNRKQIWLRWIEEIHTTGWKKNPA